MSDEKTRSREPDCLCSAYSLPISCPVHPDEVVQERDPFEEALNRAAGALVLMAETQDEREVIRTALRDLWDQSQRVALDGPPWSVEGAAQTWERVEAIRKDPEACGNVDQTACHYDWCTECVDNVSPQVRELLAVVAQQRRENAQLRARAAGAESGVLSFLRSERVLEHVAEAMMYAGRGDYGTVYEGEARRFVDHLAERLGWQRLG